MIDGLQEEIKGHRNSAEQGERLLDYLQGILIAREQADRRRRKAVILARMRGLGLGAALAATVGALLRGARDHPALAAAVGVGVAAPAAGVLIISPPEVPFVADGGHDGPHPTRTVYVPAPGAAPSPGPTVTVTVTPTPTATSPSPSPTGTGAPTASPTTSPAPSPTEPLVAVPEPSTTPGDGGSGGEQPEPEPPSKPEPDPEPPAPEPPARPPGDGMARGLCVLGLRVPLPAHVHVRVLCASPKAAAPSARHWRRNPGRASQSAKP